MHEFHWNWILTICVTWFISIFIIFRTVICSVWPCCQNACNGIQAIKDAPWWSLWLGRPCVLYIISQKSSQVYDKVIFHICCPHSFILYVTAQNIISTFTYILISAAHVKKYCTKGAVCLFCANINVLVQTKSRSRTMEDSIAGVGNIRPKGKIQPSI